MANNRIYITISSSESGSGQLANQQITTGGVANSGGQTSNGQPRQAGQSSVVDSGIKTILVNSGKTILSNAMSQYGNLTGNITASNRLNAISSIAGYAIAIYAGGWVGVAHVATDIALKQVQNFVDASRANAQSELLRQRAGNATINGSRFNI